MLQNEVIDTLMRRKSIRCYQERQPTDEVVETVVRAGMQAPFAAQLYSVLLTRKGDHPWGAPLLFTICVDTHKMALVMAQRGWSLITNPLSMLLFGIQDAALMAENMVIAGESLGLGSCFLGGVPYVADEIAAEYNLPPGVLPLVGLVMGYPDEDRPPRPRYPLDFVLFEDRYPAFTEEQLSAAMKEMDEGYLAQNYYRRLKAKIDLEVDRAETYTYKNYSWTEHISRKWGQWHPSGDEISAQLKARGFAIETVEE